MSVESPNNRPTIQTLKAGARQQNQPANRRPPTGQNNPKIKTYILHTVEARAPTFISIDKFVCLGRGFRDSGCKNSYPPPRAYAMAGMHAYRRHSGTPTCKSYGNAGGMHKCLHLASRKSASLCSFESSSAGSGGNCKRGNSFWQA